MGWHYELNLKCTILPEFVEFIKQKYLFNFDNTQLPDIKSDSEEEEDEYKENKSKENEEYKEIEAKLLQYKIIYDGLSKSTKDLIDIWIDLDICRFYKYEFDVSTCLFSCQIRKKVTSHTHTGRLWQDYELFLKDIIVPISSFIHECNIESDDFGDIMQIYTDMELRGQRFILNDMIKSINHILQDGEIVGTTLIYKRSIKPSQLIDLDRCFGK
jgi:hypothetical protein